MTYFDLKDPAGGVAPVTPNDTARIQSRSLYVGGSGDVAIVAADGSEAIFKNVPGGSVLFVRARVVKATGTTATDIVALV